MELSDVSARMFGAMRPDVELFSMSLERWMSEHAPLDGEVVIHADRVLFVQVVS